MGALALGSPHARPSTQAMMNNKINLMDNRPTPYFSVLWYTGWQLILTRLIYYYVTANEGWFWVSSFNRGQKLLFKFFDLGGWESLFWGWNKYLSDKVKFLLMVKLLLRVIQILSKKTFRQFYPPPTCVGGGRHVLQQISPRVVGGLSAVRCAVLCADPGARTTIGTIGIFLGITHCSCQR